MTCDNGAHPRWAWWKILRHLWRTAVRDRDPLRFIDDTDTLKELVEMHRAELERGLIACQQRDATAMLDAAKRLRAIDRAILIEERKIFT
jgi:hypothetical protein